MHVVGTAGHVDHGKSSLVQALTGIDPDRLKEEKEREMTIDLGFAWMKFEDGREEIGIVDVPGHRDFIENMLAGVGGIDLALLVIAADEGVMPQTAEHLAILDLLQIKGGIIALTKVDLVDDPDWLELVNLDIGDAVEDTVLENAPIIEVSAHTGEGIDKLKQALLDELSSIPAAKDISRPRLAVDRIFSMPGHGTIVTGTLQDGKFTIGDVVEIQPQSLTGRIRGLQTHKTKKETTEPGSRVAVNISGINKNQLKRGSVVAHPGTISSTILCDVAYEHLAAADKPLEHNQEVKFFSGAAEVVAKTRVIGSKSIDPGESGWLQLALQEPIAIMRGDRFILRRPSPAAMLGGGLVLDPHPGRRYRRFNQASVRRMETLAGGQPTELLLETLGKLEPVSRADLLMKTSLDPDVHESAYNQLEASGQLVQVGQELYSAAGYNAKVRQIVRIVTDYHQEKPLRLGILKEELRNRAHLGSQTFNNLLRILEEDGSIRTINNVVSLPNHEITFNDEQKAAVSGLREIFNQTGVNSPSVKEVKKAVGEDVYFALLELGEIIQLSQEVVYTATFYREVRDRLLAHLEMNGKINAAQVRDMLNTSRKYAIALLEYFDEVRLTRRVGDERELLP